jgi:signal transduction histidine kinase
VAASIPPNLLFGSGSPELEALRRHAKKARFKAGRVIFREGDPGDVLYIIDKGSVEISGVVGGSERRVFSRFGPGEYFGEMAVVDWQRRSATATAEVDTVVSIIPRDALWRMCERSPRLMVSMMREFSLRMREFDRRYLHEVFQQERLALVGRFAQSIVHDFRNPLNNIAFATHLACADDATREERIEAEATIRKQVDKLANMIGEVLEFTRPSRKPLALEKTNFREFVRAVVEDLQLEAARKSVSIDVKNPPDVELPIDRHRLPHVFTNLISNAIDFTPRGGRITLRFAVTGRDVITKVEDTGAGISPDLAGRLFKPFATHGKARGTGLGLSICKRIIEDHKGAISAQSKPGRGAVFTFSLPRKKRR